MNADKALPLVKLNLGDKERILEFSLFGVARYKQLTGKNLLAGEMAGKDPDDLIAFVWAGLVQHDDELDAEAVDGKPSKELKAILKKLGKMIKFDNLAEVTEKTNQAFLRAIPDVKSDGEEDGSEKK